MHKLQGKDSYDMNNMSQCSANLPRSLSYISCQEIQRPCVVSDLALWPPVDKNCISVWPCSACTCDGVAMHVRACMALALAGIHGFGLCIGGAWLSLDCTYVCVLLVFTILGLLVIRLPVSYLDRWGIQS